MVARNAVACPFTRPCAKSPDNPLHLPTPRSHRSPTMGAWLFGHVLRHHFGQHREKHAMSVRPFFSTRKRFVTGNQLWPSHYDIGIIPGPSGFSVSTIAFDEQQLWCVGGSGENKNPSPTIVDRGFVDQPNSSGEGCAISRPDAISATVIIAEFPAALHLHDCGSKRPQPSVD